MPRPLVWLISLAVAWAVGLVVVTLVRSVGLVVPEGLAWLAALVAGVLVTATAAAWTGALLRRDGTRARLDAVVVVVGVAAVLLLIPVSVAVAPSPLPTPAPPAPIVLAAQSALVLAAAAATASQLLRRAGSPVQDLRTTIWLLAAALLIGPATILLAALTGQAGA
jgi:hypothetical protein